MTGPGGRPRVACATGTPTVQVQAVATPGLPDGPADAEVPASHPLASARPAGPLIPRPAVPPFADLERRIEQPPASGLVVGFSGGLDSTVLLHLLGRRHAGKVTAIHVDHGLQAASSAWAAQCRQACAALAVPLHVVRVQVPQHGGGPEAAARQARWQAFADHIDTQRQVLVLAHHRDDQAETVLLRLFRGAGPAGLSAMARLSRRDNGLRVWRPLLQVPRSRLRDYAQHLGLDWIEDPTNAADDADRNLLRNRVMPLLRQRWPQLDAQLARAAAHQAQAHAHERQLGAALLAQAATGDPAILRWPVVHSAPPSIRHAALRLWLAGHGLRGIGPPRLAAIDRELLAARPDARPRLVLAGRILRRHGAHLYLLAPGADQPLAYTLAWDGRAPLRLPDGASLAIEPAPAKPLPLTVASRRGGERLQLRAGGPRRRLKHLLQEAGIPPWQRQRWPVLWLEGVPVAFADRLLGFQLARRLDGRQLRFRPAAD